MITDHKISKVFLICSGLGRVNRGFESFTQECFDALSQAPELEFLEQAYQACRPGSMAVATSHSPSFVR